MSTEFNLTGISFRVKECKELAIAKPSGKCTVALDPDNKYARHPRGAFPVQWNGMDIGFVPDAHPELQDRIVEIIDSGEQPQLVVKEYCYKDTDGLNNNDKGKLAVVTLILADEGEDLTIPAAAKVAPPTDSRCEKKISFNEPGVVVDFYPDTHQYLYKGKQLKSVTRQVAAMYAPFDKVMIAGRCEKKYGMKAADIIAMWGLNGDAASNFGTSIHELMENYQRFGERALPKMPILRDIVMSFPWVGGTVHTEVLITSVKQGMCGLCDRLYEKDGVLTVEDYKCNVGAEEIKSSLKNRLFSGMDNNKITKYIVQESIYADMLVESGLKVHDTVVSHIWNGAWSHHRASRIMYIMDKIEAEL